MKKIKWFMNVIDRKISRCLTNDSDKFYLEEEKIFPLYSIQYFIKSNQWTQSNITWLENETKSIVLALSKITNLETLWETSEY